MECYVYILECSDKTFYIGSTTNLEKRLAEHNFSKKGARYTKTRRPVRLRYFETYTSWGEALKREYELKTWPRPKKAALIKRKTIS